ncbi:hypothetical protein DFP73DRAFT_552462 [Morchella snyderi]|nr:hypothetical protein DFP73DRAFT_552462 [Morchella snyderi]
MQPTCLDRLAKRPGEEERKVGEIQRMVEGERLKENAGQKSRKKKKKNNNDDRTFSGVDIAAGEGSLEGVGVLSKPSPVPAGKIGWARAWQIQGGAALARCPRLGSPCVEEGESGGFEPVLLGGLTLEEIKRRMCETRSWYIESVDRDGGSNAMGWSGSILTPTVPVAHPEDKARGGEEKQSLEAIMIADILQKANTAEYRLKRARERIQKLEQAFVVMGKEVAKCWEEELRLSQRVGEIECRNRLIGEILGGHAPRGYEGGD